MRVVSWDVHVGRAACRLTTNGLSVPFWRAVQLALCVDHVVSSVRVGTDESLDARHPGFSR